MQQASGSNPSGFLVPSISILDSNNNGFTLSVQQGNIGPTTSRLQVHYQSGGGTGMYTSESFVHGGNIATFRWFDDGTVLRMFGNNVLLSAFPTILPYDGGFNTPANVFRGFGRLYVSSNNAERIYSASILGS